MRVIAGTHRGRLLHGPQGTALRPTSDRVREALFSILGRRLTNSCFLDLYAGTGAIGIEALSRGASLVTCVESNAQALRLLRRNVSDCTMGQRIVIHAQTVAQFLQQPARWGGPYDIVFADPPYTMSREVGSLFASAMTDGLLADDAWVIVEHATKGMLPAAFGRGSFVRRYRYGDTSLSLYAWPGPAQA